MTSLAQTLIDQTNERIRQWYVAKNLPAPADRFVIRGGRTGVKFHIGQSGSSILNCGRWVKYNVEHFRVRDLSRVPDHALCEKCFPREEAK